MIISQDNFRDEELLESKAALEKAGIEVKVASVSLNIAKGSRGAEVKPDITFSSINIKDFDAVIFVGGAGAIRYWDDPLAHKLVKDAINSNRIVGAICIGPVTLAKAGILAGKRATVFPSGIEQLKAAGAIYTAGKVEKDGNIITASGPDAAEAFGEEIAKALNK